MEVKRRRLPANHESTAALSTEPEQVPPMSNVVTLPASHRHARNPALSLSIAVAAALALALAALPPAALRAQEAADQPAKSSDEALLQFSGAVDLQNAGKFGLAADEYTDFLKRYANDPLAAKAWHYLGVCQFQSQKYDEAITAVQKAAQLAGPKFELADEAYYFLGLANYRLGQQAKDESAKKEYMTKAARALGTLATKYAKSKYVALALFYNAEAQYAAGKKAEAVKAYQMLLDEHGDSEKAPDALYGMGYALEELGQNAEAAAAYDKFLAKYSKHRLANDVSLRRGESLFAQKKFEEAAPLFAKVAAIDGFELADHALMQEAFCYYELKRYDDAAKLYLAVPERFAKSSEVPLARLNAGRALMNVNRYADARNVLAGLLGSPQKELAAEAAHLVARVALLDKRPAEAADVTTKALAAAPGAKWEAQLLFDKADALYDQADSR
jgi:TolA-binding protein